MSAPSAEARVPETAAPSGAPAPATSEIRIRAEPRDQSTCRFVLDRSVFPEGSVWFGADGREERVSRSPMAKALLEIPGVRGVLIQDDVVTVSAETGGNWMPVGREVGRRIRAVLSGGGPAVDPAVLDDLPPPEAIRSGVERVLAEEINPAVASHGGFIEVVGVEANQVYLRMGGGCQGCAMSTQTLREGVERALRRAVPEIGAVLDTTDHAAGKNPFYEPGR